MQAKDNYRGCGGGDGYVLRHQRSVNHQYAVKMHLIHVILPMHRGSLLHYEHETKIDWLSTHATNNYRDQDLRS